MGPLPSSQGSVSPLNKRVGAQRDVAKLNSALVSTVLPTMNPPGVPRCTHPGPFFHFRISFHISEPTRDLSYRKAPQGSASGDRPVHSATILLSNSQSSQAALVPQEHKMFLEEAYNAGDHGSGLRFQQRPSCAPPQGGLGTRARGYPP